MTDTSVNADRPRARFTRRTLRVVVSAALALACSSPAVAQTRLELLPVSPVDQYLDAIDRTYDAGGAWAPELGDLYFGLGQALLELGKTDEALDALREAVQNVRVNRGLEAPEQTGYLFEIAEIEYGQGRWREANELLDTAYTINLRAFGEEDPALLPVLDRMMDFYARRQPLLSPQARYADMRHYRELAEEMAAISEQSLGLTDRETERRYRTLGQVHYHTTKYVLGRGMSVEPGLVLATGTRQTLNNDTVSIKEHYQAGKEAYAKAAESAMRRADASPTERAEALALLGDWYLVFDRYGPAGKQYRQAWDVLIEAGETPPARFFGQPSPVHLMAETVFREAEEDTGGGAIEEVGVTLNVSRSGRVRRLDFVDVPAGLGEDRLRELRDRIERIRFRPALIAGEPEPVEGFTWRYPVPPADA